MTAILPSCGKKKVLLGIALCCLFVLALFAGRAEAQIANSAMADLYNEIMTACDSWLAKSGEIALGLLGITAIIGFAIGIKDLSLSGHITLDGIVALFVRHAFIIGLIVWLLQTPQRLALITVSIKKIGSTISGQDISFGGLITLFSDVVTPLVDFTKGLGWTDVGLIICMTFIIFLINCLFFMIASTVLVVEIEAVFILVGGLFTASFFVIGYFRDYFMSYIKALASVGVKMLMLCLCLGIMRNIMGSWPGMIATQLNNTESVFSFLMPMSCALVGFYMLLKAVPQFASSIMTGSVSGMDGGGIKAAAAAGYALGSTVISTSRMAAQKVIGGASTVTQAAQTYMYTSQAARDTGSTDKEAKRAGAMEAFKTVMTGPQSGGARAAGDRTYADSQKAVQFVDVRSNTDANTISTPSQTGSNNSASTQAGQKAASESVTIAGSAETTAPVASYSAASEVSNAGSKDDWGTFASDRKKEGR